MQNLLNKIISLLNDKNFDAVVQNCESALQQYNHPQLHLFLAIAQGEKKNYSESASLFKKLLQHFPDNADIYYNFAIIQEKNNQDSLAIQNYEKSLSLNPRLEFAWNNLGQLHVSHESYEKAKNCFLNASRLNPDNPTIAKNLAYACHSLNDFEQAKAIFKPLSMAGYMQEADFCVYLDMLTGENEFDEFSKITTLALKSFPNSESINILMAQKLLERLEVKKSIPYLQQALATNSNSRAAIYNLTFAYSLLGINSELKTNIKKVLSFADVDSYLFVATLYENINKYKKAAKTIKKGLAIDPKNHELLSLRVKLLNYKKQYEKALSLSNKLLPNSNNTSKANLLFQQARSQEKLKSYADAWELAKQANQLHFNLWIEKNPNPDKYLQRCQDILNGMARADHNKPKVLRNNETGSDLIFIFGFMRSGTTLLDSILSAHSKTVILEEMPLLKNTFNAFSKSSSEQYFQELIELNESKRQQLAAYYYTSVPNFIDWKKGQIIVDKSPINTSLVGFVHTLFPASKIIFSVRHPLDVCVSCFFQNFKINSFMTNMTDIVKIAKTYDAMLKVWMESIKRFNIKPYYQAYESLVTDFENQTVKLVDYLELNWQNQILNYQQSLKQRGSISAPSYNQVNQPIYQTAKNRHLNYLPYLQQASEILAPWIKYFGYKNPF